MKCMTSVLLACALVVLAPGHALSQSIADQLSSFAEDNGKLYLKPLFEGFGSSLGTGFMRSPNVHGQLGFDIGIRAMVAGIPDEEKSYTPVLPSSITVNLAGNSRVFSNPYAVQGAGTAPTVVGEQNVAMFGPTGAFADSLAAYAIPAGQFNVALPGGFNIPAVPFAVIQAGLGLGFGTEIGVRVIPDVEISSDIGKISAFGFSVTHEVSQWLPLPIPLDLAVFGGRQAFKVGDFLDASTIAFGASVGRGLGPLSAYLLAQYEKATVDIEYTVDNAAGNPGLPADGTTIAISPSLDGATRVGVGGQLSLLILHIAGEYTTGDYNVFTGRVSVGIR